MRTSDDGPMRGILLAGVLMAIVYFCVWMALKTSGVL